MRLLKVLLDNDLAVHDAVAVEQAGLFGPDANYYVLAVESRDALFDESSGNDVFDPAPLYYEGVMATDPDITEETQEGGLNRRQECEVRIPRASVEQIGARAPKPGDVIELWPTTASVDAARNHAFRFKGFFDVTYVAPEGEVGNSRTPVRYLLRCLRRDEFRPEVRVGLSP